MNVKQPFYLKDKEPTHSWATALGSLFGLIIAAAGIFAALSFDAWVGMLAWNAWLAPVLHVPVLVFMQAFCLRIVIAVFKNSPTAIILEGLLAPVIKSLVGEK